MEKVYKIGDSKIHGKGLIAIRNLSEGDLIGLSHVNNEATPEVGMFHNHSDTPNSINVEVGNERYLIVNDSVKKGEELTVNYRLQPELEQPEDFLEKAQKGIPKIKIKPRKFDFDIPFVTYKPFTGIKGDKIFNINTGSWQPSAKIKAIQNTKSHYDKQKGLMNNANADLKMSYDKLDNALNAYKDLEFINTGSVDDGISSILDLKQSLLPSFDGYLEGITAGGLEDARLLGQYNEVPLMEKLFPSLYNRLKVGPNELEKFGMIEIGSPSYKSLQDKIKVNWFGGNKPTLFDKYNKHQDNTDKYYENFPVDNSKKIKITSGNAENLNNKPWTPFINEQYYTNLQKLYSNKYGINAITGGDGSWPDVGNFKTGLMARFYDMKHNPDKYKGKLTNDNLAKSELFGDEINRINQSYLSDPRNKYQLGQFGKLNMKDFEINMPWNKNQQGGELMRAQNGGTNYRLSMNRPIYDSNGKCWANCGQRYYDPLLNWQLGISEEANYRPDLNLFDGGIRGWTGLTLNADQSGKKQAGFKGYLGANAGVQGQYNTLTEDYSILPDANVVANVGFEGDAEDAASYRTYKKGRRGDPLKWGYGATASYDLLNNQGFDFGAFLNFDNKGLTFNYNPQTKMKTLGLQFGLADKKDGGSFEKELASYKKGGPGMWANIHAKRKRGDTSTDSRPSPKAWKENTAEYGGSLPKAKTGNFPWDIKAQGFNNIQVPGINWAEGVPELTGTEARQGVNVSGINLSRDFNLGKNWNLNLSNPALVYARPTLDNMPVSKWGGLRGLPFEPKIGLTYNFKDGGSLPKAQRGINTNSLTRAVKNFVPFDDSVPKISIPRVYNNSSMFRGINSDLFVPTKFTLGDYTSNYGEKINPEFRSSNSSDQFQQQNFAEWKKLINTYDPTNAYKGVVSPVVLPSFAGNQLKGSLNKNNEISTNVLQQYIKNLNSEERFIAQNTFDNLNLANYKRTNFGNFKLELNKTLPKFNPQRTDRHQLYGVQNIGWDVPETPVDDAGGLDLVPERAVGNDLLDIGTIKWTIENPFKFKGSPKHFDDETVGGHTRFIISKQEPHVFDMTEFQSDLGQAYKTNYKRWEKTEKSKSPLSRQYDPSYIGNYNLNTLEGSLYKGFGKGYYKRLLYENLNYAAGNGQTVLRFPTAETAAKIQSYPKVIHEKPTKGDVNYKDLLRVYNKQQKYFKDNGINSKDLANSYSTRAEGEPLFKIAEIQKAFKNKPFDLNNYSLKHQTVLKGYRDNIPDIINKEFKNVNFKYLINEKTGNKHFQLDVPEQFFKKPGTTEIKAFNKGGETINPKFNKSPFNKDKLMLSNPDNLISEIANAGGFTEQFNKGGETNLNNGYNIKKKMDVNNNLPYINYSTSPNIEGRIYYDKDSVDDPYNFNVVDVTSSLIDKQKKHERTKTIIKRYENNQDLSPIERNHLNSLGLLD